MCRKGQSAGSITQEKKKIGEEILLAGVSVSGNGDMIDGEFNRRVQMSRRKKTDRMFVHLVDEYLNHVYRYLSNLLHDDEAARDLCHETFLNLRRHVSMDKEISKAYVFATARNEAISYWRRKKREGTKLEAWTTEPKPDCRETSSSIENSELGEALQIALGCISEENRSVFLLSEVEGLSYLQIAEVLGISKGTVASRKFNACRSLRGKMKGMGHELP